MRPFLAVPLLACGLVLVAAETPAPAPDAATAVPKLICQYESVTGSLAARVKRCMTAKQWRVQADNAAAAGRTMQGNGFTCGSGVRPCR